MLTCEVEQNRLGWSLRWSDGAQSYMPDEATARRCAAAGKLEEAIEEFADSQDCTCVDLETLDEPGKCRVCNATAALALARGEKEVG